MKIFTCFLLTFIVMLTVRTCFGQWVLQNSGLTTSLLDIDFINQNTGWACGDNGSIVKTTNGGINWILQNSSVTKRLEGIEAIDAGLLWCVGWWNTILKSTDGGNNWIVIRDGPISSSTFRKVHFINSETGWMLRSNYILRTTNGGISFDSTNTVFTILNDIYFKDALTGVLCADGARIMKTTDGGVVWNLVPIPLYQGEQPNFYRLSFVNNLFGWTVGEGDNSGLGKLVYKSTNFGTSWDTIARVPYPSNELNYSVFFTDLNTGFCGGTGGYIFKTTDSGNNWQQQIVPIDGFRRDFNFINDTTGWAVGGGGYILKTTNGGTYVRIETISNEIPKQFNLYQNYPNPFNPQTTIEIYVPLEDNIKIIVYDVLGKEISILADERLKAGKYKIEFNRSNLSSGIYFYTLYYSKGIITKRMILNK